MIFYERETWLGLVMASLPALFSVYFFFIAGKKRTALILLLLSAFLIRMVLVSLDPFLHEWDERFHALVAKNMILQPFKPMLFANPIVVHDYKDWSYNHIWLHKQPLFLWQMALSMKIFGINVIALRLPSVLMGTILVWMIYDIGRKWISHDGIAFIAAFIFSFSYYSLELTSGRMSTDHNDVAFLFYMTCSFWAFTKYIHSGMKLNWALLIGLFVGLAVMNKWLTGFLIYGAWGIYLLISKEYRTDIKKYLHILISLIVAIIVFMPWQIYISHAFPIESAFTYDYNQRHFKEDFGHPGGVFYHLLLFLPMAYDYVLLVFLCIGLWSIHKIKTANKNLTLSFLAIIIALYLFFSLFVATKMPMFVFPVAGFMIIIMAVGLYSVIEFISNKYNTGTNKKSVIYLILTIIIGLFALKPWSVATNRSSLNEKRNVKIYNTQMYKNLNEEIFKDKVIINCRPYENIDFMFFRNSLAYHFYPDEQTIDSLQMNGHHFLAFDYSDTQKLPDYIKNDKEIIILKDKPR